MGASASGHRGKQHHLDRALHPLRHHREQKCGWATPKKSSSHEPIREETGKPKTCQRENVSLTETIAESKPTLAEELKTFKAMVRHITKYEAGTKTGKWFQANNRPRLRRLGSLGANGHQPATAAYCKLTGKEKGRCSQCDLEAKSCQPSQS